MTEHNKPKRLFGDLSIDRGLIKIVVSKYALAKGLTYEEAHKKLSDGVQRTWGFEVPDVSPDCLLTIKERRSRVNLRARLSRKRELKAKFTDDDGAGFRDPDPVPVPSSQYEEYERRGIV